MGSGGGTVLPRFPPSPGSAALRDPLGLAAAGSAGLTASLYTRFPDRAVSELVDTAIRARAAAGGSASEIARDVARATGAPRSEVYRRVVERAEN